MKVEQQLDNIEQQKEGKSNGDGGIKKNRPQT